MIVIAMYWPKPDTFFISVSALIVAYVALCCLARWLKLSVAVAAVLMAIGGAIGMLHLCLLAAQVRPGTHQRSREWSGTSYNDMFFELTTYLDVGFGCLEVFALMLSGLVIHAFLMPNAGKPQPANPQNPPNDTFPAEAP